MDYTIRETKTYPGSMDRSWPAIELAVKGLQGKILARSPQTGQVTARFGKTIHGQVLGDRTQIEIHVAAIEPASVQIGLEAYPVDPVGRKLLFGVRKGVTRTVLTWFVAHLDHQLGKNVTGYGCQ
jgi:hypothetical protein